MLFSTGASYWLKIHAQVRRELAVWQQQAQAIPDPVLREQALQKLTGERLNAEAAAFFAVLAPRAWRTRVVTLIVAYQILYDYLDALNELPGCTGLPNGLQLHRALTDALLPEPAPRDYYKHSPYHRDGGYLQALAGTCRGIATSLPAAQAIKQVLIKATERCAQGQSHNHALRSLLRWSLQQSPKDRYAWWEIAAAGISCLAIHALLALAADRHSTLTDAKQLDHAYFPPVCAISALLDSLADYHHDTGTANHSFIAHYRDPAHAAQRLIAITQDAANRIRRLRHRHHHKIILAGITSFYLSSPSTQNGFPALPTKRLAEHAGAIAAPMRTVMRARHKAHAARYPTE